MEVKGVNNKVNELAQLSEEQNSDEISSKGTMKFNQTKQVEFFGGISTGQEIVASLLSNQHRQF